MNYHILFFHCQAETKNWYLIKAGTIFRIHWKDCLERLMFTDKGEVYMMFFIGKNGPLKIQI